MNETMEFLTGTMIVDIYLVQKQNEFICEETEANVYPMIKTTFFDSNTIEINKVFTNSIDQIFFYNINSSTLDFSLTSSVSILYNFYSSLFNQIQQYNLV